MTLQDIRRNPQLFRTKYQEALDSNIRERQKSESRLDKYWRIKKELQQVKEERDFLILKLNERNKKKNKKMIVADFHRCYAFLRKYYPGISLDAILEQTRVRPIPEMRQAIAYFLHIKHKWGVEAIGKVMKRDHSTITHAKDKITDLMTVDKKVREMIENVMEKL